MTYFGFCLQSKYCSYYQESNGVRKTRADCFLKKNLSRYAAAGKKGIEITSELWAAMRSGNDSQFILKYFKEYRKIIKKGV